MSGSSVTVNDQWKDVTSELVSWGGQWKNVVSTLVTTNGQWKQAYSSAEAPKIVTFTATPAPATPWLVVYVDWEVEGYDPDRDEVIITRTGSDTPFTHYVNWHEGSIIDNTARQGYLHKYTLYYKRDGVVGVYPLNSAGKVDQVTAKLSDLPAPTLSVSGVTNKTATLNWNSLQGVEQYRIYRYNPSNGAYLGSWYMPGTSISHSFSNKLSAEKKYRYRISARMQTEWSSLSNTVSFTTLSSPYKGKHIIPATKIYTYMPRLKRVKWDSDSVFHGRPRDTAGNHKHTRHVTMIHYYASSSSDPFANVRAGLAEGLSVTRFQIWVQRRHAGPNRPINLWVSTHRHKMKPSNVGSIRFNSNNTKVRDRVDEGHVNGEWVNLPTSLALAVIKPYGKGMALGRTNEPWTYWANFPRDLGTGIGKLKIVLG